MSQRDDAAGAPADRDTGLLPAGLPSRGAYVLAFLSVVLAGIFGAVIGYGLGDLSVDGGSTLAGVVGTIIGGAVGAVGVGVVAVLVLRAMAEWQRGGKRRR